MHKAHIVNFILSIRSVFYCKKYAGYGGPILFWLLFVLILHVHEFISEFEIILQCRVASEPIVISFAVLW